MFNEVKAEITGLVHDVVFVRNLSVTLLAAIAITCSLAELQSQNSLLGKKLSIANISDSSSMKIIYLAIRSCYLILATYEQFNSLS